MAAWPVWAPGAGLSRAPSPRLEAGRAGHRRTAARLTAPQSTPLPTLRSTALDSTPLPRTTIQEGHEERRGAVSARSDGFRLAPSVSVESVGSRFFQMQFASLPSRASAPLESPRAAWRFVSAVVSDSLIRSEPDSAFAVIVYITVNNRGLSWVPKHSQLRLPLQGSSGRSAGR